MANIGRRRVVIVAANGSANAVISDSTRLDLTSHLSPSDALSGCSASKPACVRAYSRAWVRHVL